MSRTLDTHTHTQTIIHHYCGMEKQGMKKTKRQSELGFQRKSRQTFRINQLSGFFYPPIQVRLRYLYFLEVGDVVLGSVVQVDGDLQDLLVVVDEEGEQAAGQELVQLLGLLAAQHTPGEGVHHLHIRKRDRKYLHHFLCLARLQSLHESIENVWFCVCVCVFIRYQ